MTNGNPALGMVGTAITLMFGIALIDSAHRSTKDLMKSGRGKAKPDFGFRSTNYGNMKIAPDFRKDKQGTIF